MHLLNCIKIYFDKQYKKIEIKNKNVINKIKLIKFKIQYF